MFRFRWSIVCVVSTLSFLVTPTGWAQDLGLFGGKKADLSNVTTPPGCGFEVLDRMTHIIYTAPKNFEEPIRILFKDTGGPKKPDILVWADEIHWHSDVQSGTAAGRIIVDDQSEYRVETTYVEYNHLTGQLFCPRKTKIIQKTPEGYENHMVSESALLNFEGGAEGSTGIKSAKFDRVLSMDVVIPKNKAAKGSTAKATDSPKKETPPSIEETRNKSRLGAPKE